ncbi:hypothetical protein ACM01_46185, partial [Streptomyces viridochromogenes]
TTTPHLPTYAFQHHRYWLEEARSAESEAAESGDVEARFWAAVDREDLASLTRTLGMDAESGTDSVAALSTALGVLASWRRGRDERAEVTRLRYRVGWTPVPHASTGTPGGALLVLAPPGAAEDEGVARIMSALDGQGRRSRLLEFDAAHGEDPADALGEVLAGDGEFTGVLSLLALDRRTRPESPALTEGTAATLALLRALGAGTVGLPVWSVTSGAVSVGPADRLRAPEQAVVWGLGRAVALEHPDRWGGLVDLPETLDDRTVRALLGVLGGASGEDQVAVRSAGVFARRLLESPLRNEPRQADWQPRGTVLVTGGTESLGRHAARRLALAGAEHLLLTVDGDPDASDVQDLVAELTGLGVGVSVSTADISNRAGVAELLADPAGRPALTAVVHTVDSAGMLPVASTDVDELGKALRVKADAALYLDELLGDRPLDAFVVFSSAAGVWGGGGQGVTGAVNAFLDTLVEDRRQRGLAATSVAWGVVEGIGVAADPAVQEQLRRRGVLPISTDLAMTSLAAALRSDDGVVAVADIDWSAFVPAFTSVRPSPLLGDLPEVRRLAEAAVEAAADEAEAGSALVQSLAGLSEADQKRALMKLVRERAAAALGHTDLEEVKPRQAFQEMGFDSLSSVTLRNTLAAAIGESLPATLVFDCPSPAALVDFLHETLAGTDAEEPEGDEEDLRRVLASVPLDRFREAGVLDALFSLARTESLTPVSQSGATASVADELDEIDSMDIDGLVQRALGGTEQ